MLLIIFTLFFLQPLFPQSTTNISGVVNTYHRVLEIIPAKACVRVTNVGLLDVNSYIMLAQMKGASFLTNGTLATFGDTTSLNEAGNYEIGTICYIIGDSVFLFHELLNNYNTATGKVQLVQFGQYYSANVVDTVKAAPWDSTAATGGVIAIFADQDITLTKPIWADSLGYKGGKYILQGNDCFNGFATNYTYDPTVTAGLSTGGYKGEGIANLTMNQSGGRGAVANCGGGGNNHNNSGGGGANLHAGGRGGGNSSATSNCSSTRRGEAGKALSSWNGTKIFTGGGGGAGHGNHGIFRLGGGSGGGIIFIWANNLIGNGQLITASGGAGGQSQSDGAGGGGAGGTIIMHVENYTGSALIRASGGNGGNSNNAGNIGYCYGGGGGGSGGMIYFTGPIPAITNTVTSGLAGVESGRAGCATEQPALPGTDGTVISNYTFSRSFDEAGYCRMLLPVGLVSFYANLYDKKVWLTWEIQNPAEVDQFVIEKSADATFWSAWRSITATDQEKSYNTMDPDPLPGKSYYRIRFVKANGGVSFSTIKMVIINTTATFVVYPVPADDKIIITGNYTVPLNMQLIDASGKIVVQKIIRSSSTEVDVSNLSPGLYLLKSNNSVQKIVIQ